MDVELIKLGLNAVSQVVFGIVVLSTVVVQLTPTKADDEKLNEILKKFHWVAAFLPTVGINPATKEMRQKLEEKSEEPKS